MGIEFDIAAATTGLFLLGVLTGASVVILLRRLL